MPHTWQLQEAKARFSEVVKLAGSEGPQVVTCRGVETAVVLSMAEYRRLEANRPSLVDYLMAGPKLDDDTIAVINDRSRDTGREIEL
ncbi:MAG: type II toxin-antitoxin system Phd/YefM family antitoxin [Alphaproteobacteria bacterium]|nr:type II toxin-antitoxin system Phd/YefM family antitoxin [Alphaproteobacteria bacterium]